MFFIYQYIVGQYHTKQNIVYIYIYFFLSICLFVYLSIYHLPHAADGFIGSSFQSTIYVKFVHQYNC